MEARKRARFLERVAKYGFPCVLCPHRGGALKPLTASATTEHENEPEHVTGASKPCLPVSTPETEKHDPDAVQRRSQASRWEHQDPRFAHVACLYWLLAKPKADETVATSVQRLLEELAASEDPCLTQRIRANAAVRCIVCKQRGVGLCMRCNAPSCDVGYHITCAQRAQLFMDVRTHQSLCPKHTQLRIIAETGNALLLSTKTSGGIAPEGIPPRQRRGRSSRTELQHRHVSVHDAPDRTRMTVRVPQSIELGFLPTRVDAVPLSEAAECYANLRQCRQSLEHLRTLADLVWRRESMKLGHTEVFFKLLRRSIAAFLATERILGHDASAAAELVSAARLAEASNTDSHGNSATTEDVVVRRPRRRGRRARQPMPSSVRERNESPAVPTCLDASSPTFPHAEAAVPTSDSPMDESEAAGCSEEARPAAGVGMPPSLRFSGFVENALRVAGAAFRFSRGNGKQDT